MSIQGGQIIISLPISIITIAIIAGFTVWGWSRGYRYMLTIALAVTIGYWVTVQASSIVGIVNALYAFFRRFFEILSPPVANLFPPGEIIPADSQAPLLLRVLTFYLLFAIGVAWKGPWEGSPLKGFQGGSQQLRLLGALSGFYTGILFTGATAQFWREASVFVRNSLPGGVSAVLDSLNTFDTVTIVFIVAFMILLGITLFLQFLRSLQASAAPAKK